jgi:hypothetical protein
MMGPWTVVATNEFEEWMMSLTEKQRDAIEDRIDMLRQSGPTAYETDCRCILLTADIRT